MLDIAAGISSTASTAGTVVADSLSSAAGLVAFGMPGIGELWPILLIVVLLFGGRKLPELARAAGSSITQFKQGLKDEEKPDPIEGPESESPEKEPT